MFLIVEACWGTESGARRNELPPCGIEDACIMGKLGERGVPLQPRQNLLGPRIGERALRRQEIQDRSYTGPVAAQRHLIGLARAGDEILGGADPPGRGLQGVSRS